MPIAFEHPIGPTTVDDWLAREHPTDGSRLELIFGYLHVSPPPTGQHQRAAFVLGRVIEDALREGGRTDLHVVLVLAVEIWSPSNTRTERDTKAAAYAGAGVPYFWTVNQDRVGAMTVTAYELVDGTYVEETTAAPGGPTTIKAAPVPVELDTARPHS